MKKIVPLVAFLFFFTLLPAMAGSVKTMETAELEPLLGDESVVILDVRTGRDWSTSDLKIPGAVRAASDDFSTWGESYPKDKKFVLYCA